jgi:hypothetical protein
MRSLLAILLASSACLTCAGIANAQEGFPLDGTWRGERENKGQHIATVVVVMQWDGQKISGVINPGPQSIAIADAQLIPEGWKVSVSAKSADGKPITYEGTIGKLGDYDRYIDGTWTEGGRSYHVRLVRE